MFRTLRVLHKSPSTQALAAIPNTIMNIVQKTLELLEAVQLGNGAAVDQLFQIKQKIGGNHVYREENVNPQRIRSLEIILGEWASMYSYSPGRTEGLPIVISLVRKLAHQTDRLRQARDEWVYQQSEWKNIVALRGSVETVIIYQCNNCQSEYPRMGISGFLSILDYWCSSCGTIHFASAYDSLESVLCRCGGNAVIGCGCKNSSYISLQELSPYQFFASHSFVRHNGS